MILEKQPLPDDPTPSEAPPSYDTVQTESSKYLLAEKPPLDHPRSPSSSPSSTHSPSPPSPVFTKGHLYTRSNISPGPSSSSSSTSPKSKGKSKSWFTFSPSRNSPEIRQTVLGLIRGLVRQPKPSTSYEALGVLESCAAACTNFNLSFSSLLQERFIEGHTPIYWAIIKRPAEPSSSSSSSSPDDDGAPIPDFLTTLISFADPLTPETKSEIRLACLLTSDQPLFQRLRLLPEFSPLSGTDQILLGASMPPDGILVDDVPGDDEGLFVVHFEVVQFQQRMRVSKRVALEFIARGRMWCLSFSVTPASTTTTSTNRRLGNPAAKPGSWCLTLALLEHSPPTWIDARLFIEEPRHNGSSASLLIDGASPKPKPTICFRLKTASTQLIAPSPSSSESGSKNSAADESQNEIVVSLDDSLMGSSLQYDRNSYIAQDGTLRARLEARLTKPQADCIIC